MADFKKATSKFRGEEKRILQALGQRRKSTFERFPLLFTMLGTFGLVATLYGFEHLIDKIDFLSENPLILLATGIAILIGTGKLYEKL